MATEKENQEAVQLGERAERLLKDPLIAQFLAEMRSAVNSEMERSAGSASRVQEMAYLLRSTSAFEGLFTKFMKKGTIARTNLEKLLRQPGL